ncbi:MAG TPA: Imm51 family immunity protein [bacterium]|nr:Imm51 family immunity protein [bacterium]
MRPKGPWHPAYIENADNGKKAMRLPSEAASDFRELFSAESMDGSGLDWESVLKPALRHRDKAAFAAMEFDSEADCFVALTRDENALNVLGQLIKDLLHNRHALEKAIHDHES